MRALIIASGGYLDKRIQRILSNNNINGDIEAKLTRHMMNVYDCVIFSHKNDIPNLPKLIETIALEKKLLIVYVNNTSGYGYYYNLVDDLFFSMVQEMHLDIELPNVIHSHVKYVKRIISLESNINTLEDELKLMKLTNKAKVVLINKGLTEAESHKFIQRKAMEMRISKLKLVNLIIENKIDI